MSSPGLLRLVLAAGAFAVGIDAVIVSGLLPGIKSSFGLSSGAAGQLITVFGLGYAVLAPTLGPAASARSRRLALAGGLVVFAVANGLAVLASSYALLLAARVLPSAGAVMYTPAALAQASEVSDPGRRGRSMAIVLAGATAAAVVGVCGPKTSSASCDQPVFVDQPTDASLSSDAVLTEVDWRG